MKAAIALELPDTTHRNCVFHIVSKAENILAPAFRKDQKFALEFYDIVFNSSTEGEFERLWASMVNKYNVGHLQYLRVMYDNRKRFAPVYFKKLFPIHLLHISQ
jgi:hypothetical protein